MEARHAESPAYLLGFRCRQTHRSRRIFPCAISGSENGSPHGSYNYGGTWGSGGTHYEHEVRAVFAEEVFTVAVDVSSESPANSGSVSGGGTFASGASCTVTATANNGFEFVKWTQTGGSGAPAVSTDASYTFTVTVSVHLYAHFRREATGLLLHGSSNTLLHGSSGTLLHDS